MFFFCFFFSTLSLNRLHNLRHYVMQLSMQDQLFTPMTSQTDRAEMLQFSLYSNVKLYSKYLISCEDWHQESVASILMHTAGAVSPLRRLKSIQGGDTERERRHTAEITLITHTVHLTASWNYTLFLPSDHYLIIPHVNAVGFDLCRFHYSTTPAYFCLTLKRSDGQVLQHLHYGLRQRIFYESESVKTHRAKSVRHWLSCRYFLGMFSWRWWTWEHLYYWCQASSDDG